MSETSLRGTTKAAQRTQQSLLRLVRESCNVLLSTQPSVIKSVTVSQSIENRGGARLAKRMAMRLAQEYHLDAEARSNGTSVVVRVSRPVVHVLRQTHAAGHTAEPDY